MYEPLQSPDHIRLLKIIPSQDDTRNIEISIIPTPLQTAPQYEAISYTWGDATQLGSVTCQPGGVLVQVTQNCISILRRLRQPQKERLVWIDAICINQQNIPERNAQVAVMGRIYASANRVVIDIGESSESGEQALHYLKNCEETVLYEFVLGLKIKDTVCNLYERPWFWRIWVLQEAFMARDAVVMCGRTVVPWSAFRPFRIWVDARPAGETENYHVALPHTVPQTLVIGNCSQRSYRAESDLLRLLVTGRICRATDSRDKVFALLPMLERVPEELRADYSKSVTQVYVETAKYILSTSGLMFLSCIQHHSDQDASNTAEPRLPSWVPDWSQRVMEPWMIGYYRTKPTYYPLSAGRDKKCVAKVLLGEEGSHRLQVRGREADTITHTTGKDIYINSPEHQNKQAVDSFFNEFSAYRKQLNNPATLPPPPYWEPRTSETRIHPPDWLAYRVGLPIERPIQYTDNDLIDKITHFLGPRQLVLTKRGYLGIVPKNVEVGDVVCCFLGSGVPHVLRLQQEENKKESLGRTYKLMGEGYFYGLMEGEAFCGIDMSEDALSGGSLEDLLII
ncbi:heterokaryon incompatibility protein-domain-containing protein [Pseudomassariella vexata]|uniref:Heterokaryon incompatibility protein-domain-containing protein n=1 Tax=Pseudomassariella vexata TaxID=1141098 RepID=A0A1Y2DIW2_9PEZI|nr:heterokaryon incompatibility protein-domain-containing protein [Pseudomassariella vexata]ORY59116.1 heterokaryon incompatibility protein-domain-containing protein [Pseudomassariella vexata]